MAAAGLNPVAAKLFRIRKTVCSMLTKRGYNVPQEDSDMDAEMFTARFGVIPTRESLVMLVANRDDIEDRMYVFFPEADVGVPECKKYAGRMQEDGVRRSVLVVNGKFSNFAKLSLGDLSPRFLVEHFRDEELMVDITQHELVPEHQLLTDDEKRALLTRYKLKESQLPRIQAGDAVARFFGMQRGQVVKIIRPSETAGRYVTYRIVV